MKRPVALLVLLTLLCSLTACGGNPTTQSISDVPESGQNAEEIPDTPLNTDPLTASQSSGETGNSNILIAYFTWADNTVVEEPYSSDYDQCLDRAATTGSMGGRPYRRLYNRAVSS